MGESLENLASSLQISSFKSLKEEIPTNNFELLIKKQKFPYEHCKSVEDYFSQNIPKIEEYSSRHRHKTYKILNHQSN
jgi:hypothetical protein